MAKMTAAQRNALPTSQFAGPNRTYPIPDKAHAVDAKARATQAVHEGIMSKAEQAVIDMKANRVINGANG